MHPGGKVPEDTGYGRIVRTTGGGVAAIVEHRDASAEQLAINEINAGMYCFRRSLLAPALRMIDSDNSQGEMYLTDAVGVLVEAGHHVEPLTADPVEISGVNDRAQLGEAAEHLGHRISRGHMERGVTIVQPSSTAIDASVVIEADTTIHPSTVMTGRTVVGTGAHIGPNAHLIDATIGERAVVTSSVVRNATVEPDATVGPFANVTE